MNLGGDVRQYRRAFWGSARTGKKTDPAETKDFQAGPPRPIKSMQTRITHDGIFFFFLLEHSGWRSADQKLLADISWCLMSPLGFHWLANERLGERHWADKNKVTRPASDEENLFSLRLPREKWTVSGFPPATWHLIWVWALSKTLARSEKWLRGPQRRARISWNHLKGYFRCPRCIAENIWLNWDKSDPFQSPASVLMKSLIIEMYSGGIDRDVFRISEESALV